MWTQEIGHLQLGTTTDLPDDATDELTGLSSLIVQTECTAGEAVSLTAHHHSITHKQLCITASHNTQVLSQNHTIHKCYHRVTQYTKFYHRITRYTSAITESHNTLSSITESHDTQVLSQNHTIHKFYHRITRYTSAITESQLTTQHHRTQLTTQHHRTQLTTPTIHDTNHHTTHVTSHAKPHKPTN